MSFKDILISKYPPIQAKPVKPRRDIWWHTIHYFEGEILKKINIVLFVCILVSIIVSVGNFFSTLIMKHLIDTPSLNSISELALLWLLTSVIVAWKKYAVQGYYLETDRNHLLKLLKAITTFSLLFLESKAYQDDLNKVEELTKQEQAYIKAIETITSAILGILGLYLLLLYKASFNMIALLSFFMLLVIVASYAVNSNLSSLMYGYWENYIKNTRKYKSISRILSEKDYIEEKKVYSYVPFFLNEFDHEFNLASDNNRLLGKKRIKLELATDFIFLCYSLIAFLLLYDSYLKHQITIGLFVSATGYMITLLTSLCGALGSIEDITRFKMLKRECVSFAENSESDSMASPKFALHDNVILKMDHICFQYPQNETPILKGVSFTFLKGKKYAIVGVNGSGKTTLAKVMAGLYQPACGCIESIKKPVILFQDFNRYPATLKENVTLSDLDLPIKEQRIKEERIKEIEILAGLKNRIDKMKRGDNTELTTLKENGEELSGGEWQRVALARILWCDSDIYILDEPTASLDPVEEIRIFNRYNDLLKDKTVIYITHRLGFVKNVDEVIVLNDGRISECGTHEKLIQLQHGIYKNMFEEQRKWYE